ncbi:hypothetical protein GCM10009687_56190 [Asanoa iriomotensis]
MVDARNLCLDRTGPPGPGWTVTHHGNTTIDATTERSGRHRGSGRKGGTFRFPVHFARQFLVSLVSPAKRKRQHRRVVAAGNAVGNAGPAA